MEDLKSRKEKALAELQEIERLEKEQETSLEGQFERAVRLFHVDAEQHFDQIEKSLNELLSLSNQYGVPFQSPASCLYNTYTPKSYFEKFKGLDRGEAIEMAEAWGEYALEYPGWCHSDVC